MKQRLSFALLLLLATAPNWYLPMVMFPYSYGKMLLSSIVLFFIFLLTLFTKTAAPTPHRFVWYAFGGYFFTQLLTAFLGVHFWGSVWGTESRQTGIFAIISLGMLLWSVTRVMRDQEMWQKWWMVFALAALPVALVALLEQIFPALRASFGDPSRSSAWFNNPLFLALYLECALGAIGIAFFRATKSWRMVLTSAAVIFLAALFTTGSRGAVLGVLVAGATFLSWKGVVDVSRAMRLRLVGIALLCVVLMIGGLLVARTFPGSSTARFFSFANYQQENTGRFANWNIAMQGFRERPVFGWGPEQFAVVFDRHYIPSLMKMGFYETNSDKPHNLFLELLVTSGVVGFFGWLLFWIGIPLFFLRRAWKKQLLTPSEILFRGSLLLGYVVTMFFLFELPFATAFFLMLIAETVSLTPEEQSPLLPPTIQKIGGGLLVLGAMSVMVYGIFLPAYASAKVAAAIDIPSGGLSDNWLADVQQSQVAWNAHRDEHMQLAAMDFLTRANAGRWSVGETKRIGLWLADAYKDVASRDLTYAAPFYRGQVLTAVGEAVQEDTPLQDALLAFEEAQKRAPLRQVVAFQTGKVLLIGQQPQKALELVEPIAKRDQDIAEVQWFYGILLVANNKVQEGAQALHKAIQLGHGLRSKDEVLYVVDIYAQAGGMWGDIVALYQQLIFVDPQSADLHARLAAAYEKNHQIALAILEAQKAAELDPTFKVEADAFVKRLQ